MGWNDNVGKIMRLPHHYNVAVDSGIRGYGACTKGTMPAEPRSPIYPHVQAELTRYSLSFTIIRAPCLCSIRMCFECSLLGIYIVASLSTLSKVGRYRLLPFNRVHHKQNAAEQNGLYIIRLSCSANYNAMVWQ